MKCVLVLYVAVSRADAARAIVRYGDAGAVGAQLSTIPDRLHPMSVDARVARQRCDVVRVRRDILTHLVGDGRRDSCTSTARHFATSGESAADFISADSESGKTTRGGKRLFKCYMIWQIMSLALVVVWVMEP